jgi:hypothetical protein
MLRMNNVSAKCDRNSWNECDIDQSLYINYKLNYIKGDLFELCDYSFAHCVGGDFYMNKGFAIDVRERYGNVTYLKSLKKMKGDVAVLPLDETRYIFYLVTRNLSKKKPVWYDLMCSLIKLRDSCVNLGIKN